MAGLNEWLERDVHDRHSELRGVGDRIDQLRNELAQRLGIRPAGACKLSSIRKVDTDDASSSFRAGSRRGTYIPPPSSMV
jgi:hypothetical protein